MSSLKIYFVAEYARTQTIRMRVFMLLHQTKPLLLNIRCRNARALMPWSEADTGDPDSAKSSARARAPAPSVAMLANQTGKMAEGQTGASFASALRDCMVCGLVLIDERRQLTTLAGEARQILGSKLHRKLPLALKVLPVPLQRIAEEVFASGEPIAGRAINMAVAGRGMVPLRVSAVPLSPGKKSAGAALILSEAACTEELDQNLRRLDRLATLGTLSASMAHEIKNALVAGKTFIDLLLEKHEDAELVGIVRRELARIDSILSRMLKFAGSDRPTFASVRVHEILEHSLRLVRPQLDDKSIELNCSFQAVPDLINGDDHQLQQAFVNLFLNALEAMEPNGTLTVETETGLADAVPILSRDPGDPPQVRVTIKDTGPGIPPENLPRLFEPFFTTKPEGTGLGLAITRHIIHEHRGAIEAESDPSQGTVFRIILPALDQAT
jgi:signal transduction histidine kinase